MTARNQHSWKTDLRPFADRYADLATSINNEIAVCSDAELTRLSIAVDQPSQSNCWWAVYAVAPIVRRAVSEERFRRAAPTPDGLPAADADLPSPEGATTP